MLELDLNQPEAEFVAARVDPFNSTPDGVDPGHGRVIDGCPIRSYVTKRTAHCTITGGTNYVKGVIKVIPPWSIANDAALIAGSAAGASAPTAMSTGMISWDQPILTTTECLRWRMVGCGLRVNCVSSSDDNAGLLQGGYSGAKVTTSSAVYGTYATHSATFEAPLFSIVDGITVRWRTAQEYATSSQEDTEWRGLAAGDVYSLSEGMPCVVYDGLEAGTVLLIEIVMILEMQQQPGLATRDQTLSPYSHRYFELNRLCADPGIYPVVSKGHTFKSFIRAVGRAYKVAAPILDVAASGIAGAAGLGPEWAVARAGGKALISTVQRKKKKAPRPQSLNKGKGKAAAR